MGFPQIHRYIRALIYLTPKLSNIQNEFFSLSELTFSNQQNNL